MIDYKLIVKMKMGGMSEDKIALRLGCTVAFVREAWAKHLENFKASEQSTHPALEQQFLNLCKQYNLVGESLKAVGGAIGNVYSPDELRQLLLGTLSSGEDKNTVDLERVVNVLCAKCIVLKPFVPIDPEQSMRETEHAKSN